ncbi:MAG TPA: phosphoribosylglycinamide formyltransferase [Pseudomonadales bacterium]|nr:phosphoribosylglycinamide formyltransferase [Pseudomonadales bacterium]
MRLGVLASHEGSVLQALLDACADARIAARIVLVVSNNSDSGALRRAREAGIATCHLSSATHSDPTALDQAIVDALDAAAVDLVVLAGYMKRLGPTTLERYAGRLLNTHPSLLPKFGGAGFYGRRVHEAVLASGDRESGATVHWVAGEYDTGPIVAQTRVPICANETAQSLETKVKAVERELLIETLATLARQQRATRNPSAHTVR